MTARLAAWLVLLVVFASVAGAHPVDRPATPAVPTTHAANDVLVVDDDGGADYATVQAAVDAASPGDTVLVRPGTYRERVTVAVDVALVAPRGATLDGSRFDDTPVAIDVHGNATVVVDGFTIRGYAVGVEAEYRSTADWVVRNTTITGAWKGILAVSTAGDWRVRNVTVEDATGNGVDATYATGDWVVRDTVVRNLTEGTGVDATGTTGAWTLYDVTVADVELAGVLAYTATGDWRIADSTIRGTAVGVAALETSGDWAIRGSTIADSAYQGLDVVQPPLQEGVGLQAEDTSGAWTVHSTRFVGNEEGAVVASGADPAGDARENWWGDAAGPDGDDCTGAVDCGDPLAEWPPESAGTTPPSEWTPPVAPTTPTATATATRRPTAATSPLSPAVGLVGVAAAALLVGRRRR